MTKFIKSIFMHKLTAASIAAVSLWGASAYVIYFSAEPLVSLDRGKTMVFDLIALVDATSVIVAIAVLPWVPIYFLAQRKTFRWRLLVTAISTWALLSSLFLLIENASGVMHEQLISYRATRVFGDGRDLVFMPLVIPIISALSGVVFAVSVRLYSLIAHFSASAEISGNLR